MDKTLMHIAEQRRLLRQEYEFEKAEFERATRVMGIMRLVKRGMCWLPVATGRCYYNSLQQLILEVSRSADEDGIEHNFEFGRPVRFFSVSPADGSISYLPIKATVSYASDTVMAIEMPSMSAVYDVQALAQPGVLLSFDETTYRAMFEALGAVDSAADSRLAELRQILLGGTAPQFRSLPPVGFPWLNSEQEKAVNRVLCARDVAIVHGPPGTGKTTTLVEAIYETLHREPQVLVCAQSNTAVDWISEQLVDRGVSVLRIGNPSRVNDKMLSFTYERRFEDHPSYPTLWAIRKEMRALRSQKRSGDFAGRERMRHRLLTLREKAQILEAQIDADLFNSAGVVASTLTGAAHRLMMGHHFATLFIDEAAQALEAACWIAIRKADKVVLAGDHQQLPPTVKCIDAARAGLSTTLMQRVASTKPEAVSLLRVQYRMHRAIMQFSSQWFYDGMLKAAPDVESRGILDFDTPITWVDTAGMDMKEEFVGESYGRINKAEGALLISQLTAYVAKIGMQRILDERIDFGVISPYRAQVQYLRSLIKAESALRPLRKQIAVNTVDGFQGQERDVILLSMVRANEDGQIGFLGDLRRMNVAMTRARMKLIICGDSSTLSRHPFYKKLLAYIKTL